MSAEKELKSLQLRVISKILAGFSHEMRNHLAIIKETAGLTEDIIKSGASKSKNDLLKVTGAIEEQVGKAALLCNYLGRFGHLLENPVISFNINEALADLIALISRLAHQKRITLERDFDRQMPSICGDPSGLLLLVFCLVEEIMNGLDRGGSIIIKTAFLNNALIITLIPKGRLVQPANEIETCSAEAIQDLLRLLNSTISKKSETKEAMITLSQSKTSCRD
ncbi:MAG: hypothetical protein ACLPX5_02355 [Dissulfurispiraceae bacterium]